jgi:hypothetical protein
VSQYEQKHLGEENVRIRLIAPHESSADALASPFPMQRVNLPLLAALTLPGHSVAIVEESFAPDDLNHDVDLVGRNAPGD